MQIRLPESQRARQRSLGGTLASVGVHAALVVLAVYATARVTPGAAASPPPARVVYRAALAKPPAPRPTRRSTPDAAPPRPATPPAAPTTPIRIPLDIPSDIRADVPTVALPPTGEIVFEHGLAAPESGAAGGMSTDGADGGLASPDGPLDASLVDRAAIARSIVTPRYPAALRARALQGEVVVRFVVDSAGRVAPGTLEVVRATHDLFADAVRAALARTRYVPAERAGRRVAQLVEQRFTFRLAR